VRTETASLRGSHWRRFSHPALFSSPLLHFLLPQSAAAAVYTVGSASFPTVIALLFYVFVALGGHCSVVVKGYAVVHRVQGDVVGHGRVFVCVNTLLIDVQPQGRVMNSTSWCQHALLDQKRYRALARLGDHSLSRMQTALGSQPKAQPEVGYADTITVGTQSPPCGGREVLQTGVSVAYTYEVPAQPPGQASLQGNER
jgi:hypothetical protein